MIFFFAFMVSNFEFDVRKIHIQDILQQELSNRKSLLFSAKNTDYEINLQHFHGNILLYFSFYYPSISILINIQIIFLLLLPHSHLPHHYFSFSFCFYFN
jgi:hypothetical protein